MLYNWHFAYLHFIINTVSIDLTKNLAVALVFTWLWQDTNSSNNVVNDTQLAPCLVVFHNRSSIYWEWWFMRKWCALINYLILQFYVKLISRIYIWIMLTFVRSSLKNNDICFCHFCLWQNPIITKFKLPNIFVVVLLFWVLRYHIGL